jgi:hypothetical protein
MAGAGGWVLACGGERVSSPASGIDGGPTRAVVAAPTAQAAPRPPPIDAGARPPTIARELGRVVGGVVAIQVDEGWGYASVDGRWIVSPHGMWATDPAAERGWISLEGNRAELYDLRSGARLAAVEGIAVQRVFSNGAALVQKVEQPMPPRARHGVIGRDGTWLAEARYEDPSGVGDAVRVKDGDAERWLGPTGVIEAPPPSPPEPSPAPPTDPAVAPDAGVELAGYSQVGPFVGALGWGVKDGAIVCLRRDTGKGLVEKPLGKRIDGVRAVHEGTLIVERTKHLYSACGYVNASCRVIVAPDDLTTCGPFDEQGVALVVRITDDRCAAGGGRRECAHMLASSLIDRSGAAVGEEYDVLEPLAQGSKLWRAGRFETAGDGHRSWGKGVVDAKGKLLVPLEYDEIEEAGEEWLRATTNGGKTLIHVDGRALALPAPAATGR